MFLQFVQLIGAALILAAFVLAQRGLLALNQPFYLTLNLAGSSVLAILAANERQLGFFVLEGVWAVVSAGSLITLANNGVHQR